MGRLVLRRAEANAKGPLGAFALWWIGLAVYTTILVVRDVTVIGMGFNRDLVKTTTHLSVGPLVLALWGLFYYLSYIFVGSRRVFWPSTVLYALVYVSFIYIVVALEPAAAQLRMWDVSITFATEVAPWLNMLILGILMVPILLAVTAYATLIFRLDKGEQRLRVAVVSIAFIAWFGGSLLAALMGLAEVEWWGLGSRLLSLASAGLVAFAYRTPRRARSDLFKRSLAEADERG